MDQTNQAESSKVNWLLPSPNLPPNTSSICKKPQFEIFFIKEKHLETENFSLADINLDADANVLKETVSNVFKILYFNKNQK